MPGSIIFPTSYNTISSNKVQKTGIFIDDIVEGLKYKTNNTINFTNEKGEFNFYEGDTVEFFVGSIKIGQISKIAKDNNVFIQDLLGINRNDINNTKLVKIATLLQSLDSNTLTDKIEINITDFNKFINLNGEIQNISDIDVNEILKKHQFEVVSSSEVIKHLINANKNLLFNDDQKKFLDNIFKENYLWNEYVVEKDYSKYTTAQEMINDYKYKELDKWSYAQTHEQYESFSAQTSSGFGCQYNKTIIKNALIGSPCQTAGLQRGDKVIEIDFQNITTQSYKDTEKNLGHEVIFTIKRDGEIDYISITPTNYTYKVSSSYIYFNKEDNKKIGYFIYDKFSHLSTIEIDEAFDKFSKNNIDELIIDLRYNSGGSLNTASYLLDKLVQNRANDIQFSYKHNSLNSKSDENKYFVDTNNSINLPRIVFLTSNRTASASEAVINALKPYMDVILIGDKTAGKPVGMHYQSFNDKLIYWLINFSIYNANNEGDYYDGIDVTYHVTDDITYPRDNIEDKLLNEALGYLTNTSVNTNGFLKMSDYSDNDGDGILDKDDFYFNDFDCYLEEDGNGKICYKSITRFISSYKTHYYYNNAIYLNIEDSEIIIRDLIKDKYTIFKDIDFTGLISHSFDKEQNVLYLVFNNNIKKIDFSLDEVNMETITSIDYTNNLYKEIIITKKLLLAVNKIDEQNYIDIYDKNFNLLNQIELPEHYYYFIWNEENSTLYFESLSFNYFTINQDNGNIIDSYISQDVSYLNIISISKDGLNFLTRNGKILNLNSLESGFLVENQSIKDVIWDNNNNLSYLYTDTETGDTVLKITNKDFEVINTKVYKGNFITMYFKDGKYHIITEFYNYDNGDMIILDNIYLAE